MKILSCMPKFFYGRGMLDKYLGIAQGYVLGLTLRYSQSENNHRLLHMLHNSCAMLPEYSRPAHHPYKAELAVLGIQSSS